VHDYVLWYARNRGSVKYRPLFNILESDRIESSFRYFYVDSLAGAKGGASLAKHFRKNDCSDLCLITSRRRGLLITTTNFCSMARLGNQGMSEVVAVVSKLKAVGYLTEARAR
jgi:hypothetical protein